MDQHSPFSTRRAPSGPAFSSIPLPTGLFNDVQLAADHFIDHRIGGTQPTIAQIREAFLRGAAMGLIYVEQHGMGTDQ